MAEWTEVEAIATVAGVMITGIGGAIAYVNNRLDKRVNEHADSTKGAMIDLKNEVYSLRSEIGDIHTRINQQSKDFVPYKEFDSTMSAVREDLSDIKSALTSLTGSILTHFANKR